MDIKTKDSTVRVGPLVNIPTLLLKLGCDPEPILENAGFRAGEFEDIEHKISYLKGSRLLADCVAATGCDQFGLMLGQMAGPSHLGVAGFLACSALKVGQALETLVENLDLHDDGGTCTLQVGDHFTQLSFHIHQPGVKAVAQIYDLSAVVMCKLMRALCGRDWNPSQVLLMRARPQMMLPYSRFFRAALLFDSKRCGIVFPNHDLQRSPPMADSLLYQHLEEEALALHQLQNHGIMEALPVVLQKGLLQKRYLAGDIADVFGIQERTLHRRLKAAGTSFRHELDGARESLSKQLLEYSNLPVYEVATSLGYADSSGFIRAFHRWAGASPASWRKQRGSTPAA